MNTNYIPLYRKYRPQSIEQIVGQEHIKKALANAIDMNRISHAYLFTGPRGTGKTSTARIFAKSLNCENGPTLSPCNSCENCKNITNSIPIDVIEIDAASNRSVSDADDIIQKVALAPVQSRYKIYIIDEVHMLTNQAFNALLKTLEEPPKNVIFILATTEVHKVLDTIKSRCQRFDFKRITTDDITKHLRYIADNEKINITDDALYYIAQNSAGGMRDSIALLDQLSVLNSTDKAICVDDINNLLGRLSFNSLTTLFEHISNSSQNEALNTLNNIYNEGNEPVQILSNFLDYLRNALIIKTAGKVDNTVVQLNEEQIQILLDKIKNLETHQIVSLIDKCANYIKELKLTSNPKLWLDIGILDMSNLAQNTKLEELQKRISLLEKGTMVKESVMPEHNTPARPVKIAQEQSEPVETKQIKPTKKTEKNYSEEEVLTDNIPISKAATGNSLKTLWAKLIENVQSPSSAILQQQALPVKITSEEVIVSIKSPIWLKQFGPEGNKHQLIVKATAAIFGAEAKKVIVRAPQPNDDKIRNEQSADEEKPAPAPKAVTPKTPQPTIEEIEEAKELKQESNKPAPHHKTADEFNHTDDVNMIVDLFEGKIIE